MNNNKYDKNSFSNFPLQSSIFKHFTWKNIMFGAMFIIISVTLRLFFFGLDLSEYPIILELNLSKYFDLFSNVFAFMLILPVYLSGSGDFMGPTIMFMNGADGNTGGAGSTGASNTTQTGPSNPNTTQTGPSNPNPTQAGFSNRQRANYSSRDASTHTEEVLKKEVLRNKEYRDTVDELLRLERENPKLITNIRKGIHPTKVTLSQAKKRMIAYKKDLGLD